MDPFDSVPHFTKQVKYRHFISSILRARPLSQVWCVTVKTRYPVTHYYGPSCPTVWTTSLTSQIHVLASPILLCLDYERIEFLSLLSESQCKLKSSVGRYVFPHNVCFFDVPLSGFSFERVLREWVPMYHK